MIPKTKVNKRNTDYFLKVIKKPECETNDNKITRSDCLK